MGLEGVEGTPIRPKPPKMYGDAEEAMGLTPEHQQAIVEQVKPQPNNVAAYLQARMRNPSLPRVPTPEILRSLGITP
jgi:hypothetical protein